MREVVPQTIIVMKGGGFDRLLDSTESEMSLFREGSFWHRKPCRKRTINVYGELLYLEFRTIVK